MCLRPEAKWVNVKGKTGVVVRSAVHRGLLDLLFALRWWSPLF